VRSSDNPATLKDDLPLSQPKPIRATHPIQFPRRVEAEPSVADTLRARIAAGRPLWAGGELRVARAPLGARLLDALRSARSASRLVQGLEAATLRLAVETRGLRMADARGTTERGQRISRLLLVSNDGSERFYRDIEALVRRHEPRVLAVRLDADSSELGGPIFGRERMARLVLLEHKDAVATTLLVLADPA
jgi:hypothetical protein